MNKIRMLPGWIHKDFKWNGRSFSSSLELLDYARQHCPEAIEFLRSWIGNTGIVQVNTSGSTGRPKEIVLDREKMMDSARATGSYFELGAGSRALLCLPLQYIAGKMMLVRAMTLGWNLFSSFPVVKIEIGVHEHFDFVAMVPLQLAKDLQVIKNTRVLLLGGGEVSEQLQELIKDSACRVYLGYGMTETITHVAVRPLNRAAGLRDNRICYKALPGISFRTDERGCLVIEAPRLSEKEIVTNDLVELESDSSFRWLARYDNIINSAGIKLVPELIEAKLRSLVERAFFVHGLDDELLGQRLVMVVEGQAYDLLSKLRHFQEQNPDWLKKYELPKEIFFVSDFIRTETGKVHRKATVINML